MNVDFEALSKTQLDLDCSHVVSDDATPATFMHIKGITD
jgi:hypothetical protein